MARVTEKQMKKKKKKTGPGSEVIFFFFFAHKKYERWDLKAVVEVAAMKERSLCRK